MDMSLKARKARVLKQNRRHEPMVYRDMRPAPRRVHQSKGARIIDHVLTVLALIAVSVVWFYSVFYTMV